MSYVSDRYVTGQSPCYARSAIRVAAYGCCPSHSYPSHSYPSRRYPSHSYPSRSCPSRSYPSHSCPSRSYPSRNYPSRSYPSRSYPSRSYPSHIAAVPAARESSELRSDEGLSACGSGMPWPGSCDGRVIPWSRARHGTRHAMAGIMEQSESCRNRLGRVIPWSEPITVWVMPSPGRAAAGRVDRSPTAFRAS